MHDERRGTAAPAARPETGGRFRGPQSHEPYVSASSTPAEFSVRAASAGIALGILFGAANAYIGLKTGLTISTSIPVAVMTVALFRALSATGRTTSILEANQSQTIGSASSSVASGVIFTLPALFLWGFDPGLLQMTLLALCGGLLGVLFMVPLRKFLIVEEHGRLPYPEGTACAEVLVASELGGGRARAVFWGLGIGMLFEALTSWAKLIPREIETRIPFLKKGEVGLELSAALFGVGYILGPRIAAVMVGGGLLSSLVIIPAIAFWGDARVDPLFPETVRTITEMSAGQIWHRYVRYIGAGAVATGGLLTLIRSIPVMLSSFRVGARELKERIGAASRAAVPRTARELPLKFVGLGVIIVFLGLALIPGLMGPLTGITVRLVAAFLVVLFAFFFVTVSSRIVGLVGVTSNPTSGMTIASLLGTSGVFYLFGWTDDLGKVAALTVGCVIAIAASIAGDTSQDLKTGFLLGATPRRQQIGELLGVLTSAAFVCYAVIVLDKTYGFGSAELAAPQATLMKLVIEGVLDSSLPWALVGIGAAIALVAEVFRIPSLPFAVGVYLPVATMTPVFLGGALRLLLDRSSSDEAQRSARREQGILLGSGLVGGTGLLGVAIAGWAYWRGGAPQGFDWAFTEHTLTGLVVFGTLVVWFARRCAKATG